jgi:O-antigen/teichoic acid export membrane protein
VNTAFLPGLSSAGEERPRLAAKMLGLDLAIGLALALLLALSAEPAADRFFGDGEAASVDVLRVLCFALVLRFVNNGLATWLTAAGHQWRRTMIAITAGSFNIVVNLVAISIWGYWAAVWTTIATECLILGISALALRGEVSVAGREPRGETTTAPAVEGYGLGRE